MRTLWFSCSTKYFEPVTVPTPPRNDNLRVTPARPCHAAINPDTHECTVFAAITTARLEPSLRVAIDLPQRPRFEIGDCWFDQDEQIGGALRRIALAGVPTRRRCRPEDEQPRHLQRLEVRSVYTARVSRGARKPQITRTISAPTTAPTSPAPSPA